MKKKFTSLSNKTYPDGDSAVTNTLKRRWLDVFMTPKW